MIKKLILGAFGVVILLVAILAVHIYQVTDDATKVGTSLAMSKILLQTPLDATTADKVKTFLKVNSGVKDIRVNRNAAHAICLYDRNQTNVRDLIAEINREFGLQATLFQPSADELAMSCPAIDKNSVAFKLGTFFEDLFANR